MDENVNAPQTDEEGADVRHGLIGMLRAGDAHIQQSASVIVTAKGSADLQQSAAMALVSGGDTSMKMAAAVAVPTLGDVHMEKAGAQWVVAAGDVTIEKGGCAAAVAPSVSVNNGGIGVALGWRLDVGENSRVLFGPLAAVGLGLAFGLGMGLMLVAGAGYAGSQAWKHRPQQLPWRS